MSHADHDPTRLRRMARVAREEGVEEIVIGLTYSISPVHTHAYYAERAAALADCPDMDRLYLKDPGGLLTPDRLVDDLGRGGADAGQGPQRSLSDPLLHLAVGQAGDDLGGAAEGPNAVGGGTGPLQLEGDLPQRCHRIHRPTVRLARKWPDRTPRPAQH